MDALGSVSPVASSEFPSLLRWPSLRCPLPDGSSSTPSLPDCGSLRSSSSPPPSSEPSSAGLHPLSSLRLSSASSGGPFYPGKRYSRGPGSENLFTPGFIGPPQWRSGQGSLGSSTRSVRRPPTQGPVAVSVRSSTICLPCTEIRTRMPLRCNRRGIGACAASPLRPSSPTRR